jgi:hypothetical protein
MHVPLSINYNFFYKLFDVDLPDDDAVLRVS